MFKNIFKFVSPIFFLILIAFSQNSYAQLSGTYAIPDSFATVKAAIDSLNLVGVGSGGVTFNVTAGHTETTTDSLVLTATGTSSNPIIFQKSGVGANPLITRTDAGTKIPTTLGAQGDAVITIQGSDYVTFDGIDVAATFVSTNTTGIEYGYYLRKVSGTDGCKYVTIKNSVIDMTKGTSAYVAGIYSSNNTAGSSLTSATGIAITDISGRNEFVTLTGNTIQDVHAGIILRGFNHTTSPNDFQDFNFVVGASGQGNIIQNYAGGSATTSYGVYLINHTNPTVSYNTINNVAGGGANSTAQIYGIFMSQSATNPGGIVVMNNNNITIGQANTAAVASITIAPACVSMTVNDNTFSIGTFASTSASFLINITGAATTKTVNGNQNIGTITKTGAGAFTCLSSSGSPVNGTETFTGNKFSGFTTTTTSSFTGITVSSSGTSTRYFYNNKVSNVTLTSGAFTGMSLGTILTEEVYNDTVMTATGTGSNTGISCSSTQVGLLETVRDNYVTGLTFAGGSGTFIGIQTGGPSSTSTRYVYNNTVTNCSGGTGFQSYGINSGNITNQEIYNNLVSGITAGGNLNGLTFASQANGLSTVYNNTVYDLTTNGDTRSVIGISNASAGTTYFYKNSASKLRHTFTGAGASSTVRGIDVTIGYKNYVYNNIVSDLDAPNITSTGNNVYGINSTNSANTNTIYLYNNTVYVNSTGTTYKSYGIFSNSSHNTELRNNLVVNNSAGLAFAYGRSTNALGTYSMLSGNNNFYSSYKTYIGGTTDTISTISQFRTTFYPREQSSFAENSPFVNVATAPFDVHINSAIASQTESGGRPVTTPIAITDDYDGNVRNATFPDVGADEFSGIASDLTGPAIVYTPLGFTGSTADRTLVVNISDPSGVPSTLPGRPVLYWKKNYNGTWTADTVDTIVGNDYTFTFGSGVTMNDTVFYYAAAQDLATTPNVRIVPTPGSGGYTINPPAASTPPTNPDWYKISNVSLAGDYTVGVAEFNRITGRTITFERSGDKLIPMENGKPYTEDLYVKKAEHPEYNYPDNVQGVYTTLTSAVTDLNLRGVTAPVNFLLTDALYDGTTNTFPLVIKVLNENLPTAVNQVTFKPDSGVTSRITHSLATNTIFKILSKYINIDGSNSGGTDRSLTVENSSATSPRVIWFGSVGTNPISWCTVKNCKIIVPGTAADGYGVSIADSATAPTAGYSNNITVQNNYITGPYGVYVFAPVVNNLLVPGNGSGLSINGNTIDSSFNGGMYLFGLDNISVTNNTVSNVRGTTGGGGFFIYTSYVINSSISNNIIGPNSWAGGIVTGIRVGNNLVTNSNLTISGNTISGLINPSAASVNGIIFEQQTGGVVISNNKISNLKQTNTTSRSVIGINLNGGMPNGSITVANNFIWDIASYGDVSLTSNNAYGIAMQSFTTGANGYKIYHNTVALTTDQTLTTSNPACLFIGSGISTPGAIDIRDNIFANYMTVGANRYAVINGLATNANLGNINYNDYYTTGPNLGRQGSTNYANIIDWRTATGQDVNSVSGDPGFVSATDLHINTSSLLVSNNGTYLGSVPTDIDGDTRNNPPDIGADEYTYISPVVNHFRTKASGNWNALTTWEMSSNNLNWVDASVTPNDSSNTVTILSGDTITVTQSVDVDQTVIEAGGVAIVNGTPVVFTISDGPDSLDMIVNGYLKATGSPNGTAPHSVNAEGTLQFGSTGVYEHNQNSGGIPVSQWTTGSTAIITGTTGGAPANRNQNYYNLTFNTPGNTATGLNMGFDNNVIGGDINIISTGTGRWQITEPASAGDSLTVAINGNIIQTGGNFSSTGSETLSYVEITVNGNVDVTGGNFSVSLGSQGGGTTKWYLYGENFSMSNATTQNSNSAGAKFIFSGTTQQNLTLSNVTFTGGFPVEVAANAILDAGVSQIKGSGIFTLNDGASLNTSNTGGLDSLLQNTGTKTLSTLANYTFKGTDAQNTGNLLPSSVNTLTVDNTAGVTLSHHSASASTLNLAKGKLNTSSTNMLTVSGTLTNSIVGGNDTTYVNGPLALTLPSALTAGSTYNFPIGKGFYRPLALVDPVTNADGLVIIQSEVFDANSGGTPGSGLSTLDTNRYWSAAITSGDTNFTSSKVRLTEAGLTDTSGIGKSATQMGVYDLVSSITPSGGSITSDEITSLGYFAIGQIESGTSTFALSVDVTLGWNMVSAPGLHPTDQNVGTWWPHRTGTVWEFDGTQYSSRSVTTPGEGYWMKNTLTETYTYPAIQIVPHNPIFMTLGWNLMGGYETSPTITALKAANPQITGTVWGFDGVQYVAATNLVPGYGYWAKVTSAGNITIPDALAKGNGEVVELFKEDWGRITITDAAGISSTLYAVNGEVDLDQYEMPPLPPLGMFDVRYTSGRIAEDLNSIQTIDMTSVEYPITVTVENMTVRLQDETGRLINQNINSGEKITISNNQISKLRVTSDLIPTVYALEQNYPNPFNPSTTIEFSLPEDVNSVKLTIYNALGERVAELINGSLTAGKYSYQWNAGHIATGMYIYELRTDNFVSIKKMVLLK